ncbi:hypothetical protein EDD11_000551 [Mortierella claussenii]|nr:hypothetical protein EDD11_000551 [Mortierella claussenii]
MSTIDVIYSPNVLHFDVCFIRVLLLKISYRPLLVSKIATLFGTPAILSSIVFAIQVRKLAQVGHAQSSNRIHTSARFLDVMTAFVVFTCEGLIMVNKDSISPSLGGLALGFTLTLVDHVTWFLRIFTRFQGDIVSVEWMHEYACKQPEVMDVKIPDTWEDQDLIHKDMSFEVMPKTKIGIVGRTGVSKPRLTLGMFRIIGAADSYWARMSDQGSEDEKGNAKKKSPAEWEGQELSAVSACEGRAGSIGIDGLDISTLGWRGLRRHQAIIPQDPPLFTGTVRENLDPFHEMTDAEL